MNRQDAMNATRSGKEGSAIRGTPFTAKAPPGAPRPPGMISGLDSQRHRMVVLGFRIEVIDRFLALLASWRFTGHGYTLRH